MISLAKQLLLIVVKWIFKWLKDSIKMGCKIIISRCSCIHRLPPTNVKATNIVGFWLAETEDKTMAGSSVLQAARDWQQPSLQCNDSDLWEIQISFIPRLSTCCSWLCVCVFLDRLLPLERQTACEGKPIFCSIMKALKKDHECCLLGFV